MIKEDWVKEVLLKEEVLCDTQGGYTFEKVMAARNVAKTAKYWYKIQGKDKYLFKSSIAESWEFTLPEEPNPIRNMDQVWVKFKDSYVFTKEASFFSKHGKYTTAGSGTPNFERYWKEQAKFCRFGKVVDGVRVSGRYYFMLNFTRMQARFRLEDGQWSDNKVETFPSFVDHQYYLINEWERWFVDPIYSDVRLRKVWFPLLGKKRLAKLSGAVPKARRKGISYADSGAVVVYNFWWVEDSFNFIGAYQEDFYSTLLDQGVHKTKDFLNQHTPWKRRTGILKQKENFRASYSTKDEHGIDIVEGYNSEVYCASFGGTSFKGVGKSCYSISIEEAGKFNNLTDTYSISIEPLIRDGAVRTGTAIIFGTSGELEGSGGSLALYDMAYNPKAYGLVGYDNIYDDNASGKTSLFIDDLWYFPLPDDWTKADILELLTLPSEIACVRSMSEEDFNAFDSQGNSLRFVARAYQLNERRKKKAASNKVYMKYITQQPLSLQEAFLVNDNSPFDKPLIQNRIAELLSSESKDFEWGYFDESSDGTPNWVQDFHGTTPVEEFPNTRDDEDGCWVLFERPVTGMDGKIASRRYIAATDPNDKGYDESNSDNKHSLASTFILDSFTGNIVAEYSGRTNRIDTYFRIMFRGLRYYNALTLFENNKRSLGDYAKNNKLTGYLAFEPSILKTQVGYKIGKTGTRGVHVANKNLSAEFRSWLADWLDDEVQIGVDDEGYPILGKRVYSIKSLPFLQELVAWNHEALLRKTGNYDRISAMEVMMVHLHEIEATRGKRTQEQQTEVKAGDQFFDKISKMYKRR